MTPTLRSAIAALILSVVTPVGATDLLEVYQKALQSDPQIREADAIRLAARESKPQAVASLLPQLNATGAWSSSDSDGTTTISRNSDVNDPTSPIISIPTSRSTDIEGKQYQLQLTQTLFRWDQWVALKRADAEVAQAEANYMASQQDLAVRVAQRYFEVLSAKDTLDAGEATLEAVSRQLEQAEKRFEVGLIAITDVQEARAARDLATATIIAGRRSLATAKELLRELTGELFDDLAAPGDDMPLNTPDPASEDQWVTAALEQNLAVVASRLAVDIASQDVRTARSGHLPSLDLVLQRNGTDNTGTLTSGGLESPNDSDTTQDSISLQLVFPIYSGGATSSRVRQQVYLQRAARERLERAARETERSARDSYLGVLSAISQVQATRQALESSRTALQATEAGFEVGTRTTIDVLDARRQLFTAQTAYARARYDYILNVVTLKQSAGALTREDLAEINGWLQP